ncbi:MAG: undecaprenyl-diphosphate phosphatase [Isosphaeraceae bacterium]
MTNWLEALFLGLVQGITEFLPVSSSGHLAVVQTLQDRAAGRSVSGAEHVFFDVMLHVGTLMAIIVYYRKVVRLSAAGLLGSTESPPPYQRPAVVRTGINALVATLPLVPYALIFKKYLDQTFESLTAAALGFLVTATVLAITARLPGGTKGPSEMTWRDALLIGIVQMFAPLPGVSRSGLTIVAALAIGLSRAWAVQFSLLIAVPAILGAAVFEIRKVNPDLLTPERLGPTIAATVLAGLVGYMAIIWLVRIVRSGRLWYFSVYLVVLATVILVGEWTGRNRVDGRQPPTLDRPVRNGPRRPGPGPGADRAFGALDRPHAFGKAEDAGTAGQAFKGRQPPARLVLG